MLLEILIIHLNVACKQMKYYLKNKYNIKITILNILKIFI